MFDFSKKNKKNVDWNYVYTVFDKVAKKSLGLFYSTTDENMIRTSLPSILMDYPFRDIEIRRIGRFESNSGVIESMNVRIIPLEKYTFPHSRLSNKGDDLSLEDLDKGMKDFKSKKMAEIDSAREFSQDSSVSDSKEA